jgi:ferric-dicitrate binding protein FerR (iron transport regulator)
MSAPRYARGAAAIIARAVDREAPPPSAENRDRAIAALEQAIRARARQRRRTQYVAGAIAATALAAGLAVVVGHVHGERSTAVVSAVATPTPPPESVTVVAHPVGGGADVIATGGPAQLAEGTVLGDGSRVVAAANGRAELAFSTGTKLTVEEGGDLTIVEDSETQLFALAGGSLRAKVAKLGPHQRFVVRTRDAEVEVRGTEFRLRVTAPDVRCSVKTTTRLDVSEGVVVVRAEGNEVRVGAGESWPRCATTSFQGGAPPAATPLVAASAGAHDHLDRPEKVDPSSTLAAQNDAFSRAVAAKRRGAADEALASFDRFLVQYPGSPLAESALVEKMRLLSSRDRKSASSLARQYLASYPAGFARAEAESLSGAP